MFFQEQEIVISGTYPLAGTLALPEGDKERYPAIVMVHGSGDIDRDGNAKQLHMKRDCST
ncbi:hypothetical protein [Aneurinibacillus sp. UBA3580]|uniref:hypothetical protein n=1 Tax=Aneurinibacillus sp. UBA3580 TaxID=1946041 RepID=UPI002580F953|nr:hypothetical protein [Aneurinibacillus sp. UBA3580]